MKYKNALMLYIVGIGPGDNEYLTLRAYNVLKRVNVVLGHKRYIELIENFLAENNPNARIIVSKMGEEVERAKLAIELSKKHDVALISGGDPNIYGIANLVLEIMAKNDIDINFEIIPGISAFNIAGALLGSPFLDVALINLSDLLVPWEEIEKKIEHALKADFILALYNPSSRKRKNKLEKAIKLIKNYRPNALVGVVTNATRKGECVVVCTLDNLNLESIGMSTILIVGGSKTFLWRRYMITPRGYDRKYRL